LIVNKELQDRLLEYLGSLDGAVRQAGGFVAEQAPLVAQEWLAWQVWSNLAAAIVWLVLAIACGVVARRCWIGQQKNDDAPWFIGYVCGGLGAFVFVIISVVCAYESGKAHFAPRVTVLEKITELAKPTGR
jgi:hypothetical protein